MIVVKIPGLIILRVGRLDRKKSRLRVFAYFLCCTIKNSPCATKISSVLKTGQNMWLMFLLMTTGSYRAVPAKTLKKKHSALRTNSKLLMVSFVRIGHLPSCDKKIYIYDKLLIYVNPKLGAKNCKW